MDGLLAVRHHDATGAVETRYDVVRDERSNVAGLIDHATDKLVAGFEYTPFGEVAAIDSADPAVLADPASICPLLFSMKYLEGELPGSATGQGQVYYFGYRYLDARLGKWLSRDPIAEQGGLNLYAYVTNDPVNYVDPLGLSSWVWPWDSRAQWGVQSTISGVSAASQDAVQVTAAATQVVVKKTQQVAVDVVLTAGDVANGVSDVYLPQPQPIPVMRSPTARRIGQHIGGAASILEMAGGIAMVVDGTAKVGTGAGGAVASVAAAPAGGVSLVGLAPSGALLVGGVAEIGGGIALTTHGYNTHRHYQNVINQPLPGMMQQSTPNPANALGTPNSTQGNPNTPPSNQPSPPTSATPPASATGPKPPAGMGGVKQPLQSPSATSVLSREEILSLTDFHLDPLKSQFPNAKIGVRGSLPRGVKGHHKQNAPFDPTNFDVDAFIVSDELAAQVPKNSNGFRNLARLEEYQPLVRQIGDNIKSIPGHRPNDTFKVRVYSEAEFKAIVGPDEIHMITGSNGG